jgi:hypothetical protein
MKPTVNNRLSSTASRKTHCRQPLIEACEPRMMMSASPVDFSGEYVAFQNSQVIAVNIRPGKITNSFTGDVDAGGVDRKFSAKESSTGDLSGILGGPGKKAALDATLSGTTLTLTYGGASITTSQVSTTPAPLPSKLVKHAHSEFSYSSPGNWKVSQGTDGILMSSKDGTEQVGVFATVAGGYYTSSQIADSEVAAGGTILSSKFLANGAVSSTEYKQAGIGVIQFNQNGTPYVSGQIIETLNFSNAGANGETLTLLCEVTAPKSEFPAACPTLIDMLTSIKRNPAGKVGKTPVQSKTHVPGTSGNWSSSAAYAAVEEQYAAAIEAETLYSQEGIDSSVDSFCNYLTS